MCFNILTNCVKLDRKINKIIYEYVLSYSSNYVRQLEKAFIFTHSQLVNGDTFKINVFFQIM